MAIYNRWGDEVKIIANCGDVTPKDFSTPVTLVQVEYDDHDKRFQFADFLKADNGWPEIKTAVDALPVTAISSAALKTAINQAM